MFMPVPPIVSPGQSLSLFWVERLQRLGGEFLYSHGCDKSHIQVFLKQSRNASLTDTIKWQIYILFHTARVGNSSMGYAKLDHVITTNYDKAPRLKGSGHFITTPNNC